jgi:hypothetical protein
VIEVGHTRDLDVQLAEEVEEADGVRSTRYGRDDARSVRQHAVTRDGG